MNRNEFDAFVDRAVEHSFNSEEDYPKQMKSLVNYLCMWEPLSHSKEDVWYELQRVQDIQGVGRQGVKNRVWAMYEQECRAGYVPPGIFP